MVFKLWGLFFNSDTKQIANFTENRWENASFPACWNLVQLLLKKIRECHTTSGGRKKKRIFFFFFLKEHDFIMSKRKIWVE